MGSLGWARGGRAACVLVLFVGGAVGCGSSSSKGAGSDGGMQDAAMQDAGMQDGGGDGGAPLTLASFCQQLPDDLCSWFTACRTSDHCTDPYGPVVRFQDQCAGLLASVAAGRVTFDPALAQQCLDSIDNTNCGPAPDALWGRGACIKIFEGTVPVGGDCYQAVGSTLQVDECAGGYCTNDACPGKCVAYAATNGGSCTSVMCDPSAAWCNAGSCEAVLAENADCSASGQCGPGLVCASASGTQTCLPMVEKGDPCVSTDQCEDGICVGGICTLSVGVGDDCKDTYNCPAGTYCGAPAGEQNTCRSYQTVGMPCAGAGSLQCDPSLLCDFNNMCIAFGTVGQACSGSQPCESDLWCAQTASGSSCHALGAQGDDCSDQVLPPAQRRCQTGLACVPSGLDQSNQPTGWHCEPPGNQGDLCNGSFEPVPNCDAGLYCAIQTFRCSPPNGVGGMCQLDKNSCMSGLYCDDSGPSAMCAMQLADGMGCTNVKMCTSGYCDFGTNKCAEPPIACTGAN